MIISMIMYYDAHYVDQRTCLRFQIDDHKLTVYIFASSS